MPSPLFSIWFILLSPFFTASLQFFSHNWENENFCVKWGLNEDHFSSLVLMRTKSSIEDLYGSTVYLVSLRNKSLNYVLPRLSCKFSSWMARRRPWSRQPLSAAGHFNPCTFVLKFPCSGHRNVCNFCTRGEGSRNITSQVARRESGSKWKTRHVIWVIIHDFH